MATRQMKLIHLNDDSKRRSIALCLSAHARTQARSHVFSIAIRAHQVGVIRKHFIKFVKSHSFTLAERILSYVGSSSIRWRCQQHQQQRPNLYSTYTTYTHAQNFFSFNSLFFSLFLVFFAGSYCSHYFHVI